MTERPISPDIDNATDWYLSRSHVVRALGHLGADLAERGLLPADFEQPQLLDLFETAIRATLDMDDLSPVDARLFTEES